jgi:hypothetical protein
MRLDGFVEKGWGSELIWAINDLSCGKLLKFNEGARFSTMPENLKDFYQKYTCADVSKLNKIIDNTA